MSRFTSLVSRAVMCVAAASPLSAWAATVSYVGQDLTVGGQWRTASVAKTMDIDGDNVYGSSGYVLFGTAPATGSTYSSITTSSTVPSVLFASNASIQTLSSLPTGLTVTDGPHPADRVLGGQYYHLVDDPTHPGSQVMEGWITDYVGYGTSPNASPDNAELITLTIGAGTPGAGVSGATLRVGMYIYQQSAGSTTIDGATQLTVGSDSPTSWNPDSQVVYKESLVAYDIQNYQVGDHINIWLQGNTGQANSAVNLTGLTFDIVTVPEPAGIALMTAGFMLTALRRRQSHAR